MWKDAIVEEIRKVRDAHAMEFNYDVEATLAIWISGTRSRGADSTTSAPSADSVMRERAKA